MGERTERERHLRQHQRVRQVVNAAIAEKREALGIEAIWRIQVVACCPHELPNHEANIWWDSEVYYAKLKIRCNLEIPLLRWLAWHELCELQVWRTTTMIFDLLRLLREGSTQPNALMSEEQIEKCVEQWNYYRNQEIENRVFGLLQERRPGHVEAASM